MSIDMPKLFTVEIQYGTTANEPDWDVWGVARAVKVAAWMTPDQVAEAAAREHARVAKVVEGEHWRAVVWEGADRGIGPVREGGYDTGQMFSRQDPAAEYYYCGSMAEVVKHDKADAEKLNVSHVARAVVELLGDNEPFAKDAATTGRTTWTYEIQERDRCGSNWCPRMDPFVTTTPADWTASKVAASYADEAARLLCSWEFRVCVWRGDMTKGGWREPDALALGEELLNAAADRAMAVTPDDAVAEHAQCCGANPELAEMEGDAAERIARRRKADELLPYMPTHGDDLLCLHCEEHIADPHAPECPNEIAAEV